MLSEEMQIRSSRRTTGCNRPSWWRLGPRSVSRARSLNLSVLTVFFGIIAFEWDPDKASSNAEKHGVSFDEAATAFGEPPLSDHRRPWSL